MRKSLGCPSNASLFGSCFLPLVPLCSGILLLISHHMVKVWVKVVTSRSGHTWPRQKWKASIEQSKGGSGNVLMKNCFLFLCMSLGSLSLSLSHSNAEFANPMSVLMVHGHLYCYDEQSGCCVEHGVCMSRLCGSIFM